ncbi:MAG: alpha-L-fucosidase [Victivallaceae bacterium]|nr:alpha-L-fucosidase [Victivallaceae bacterium]
MTPDEYFRALRFGMFIHWGLYAIPGGVWHGKKISYIGEWLQAHCRIPHQEYAKLAGDFNPRRFDADEWISLAKAAGFNYIVFTAKHHDGFAMYKSNVSAWNVVDATPFKRDILAELAAACRKHGVALGIYYSHYLDWSDPDGGDPAPEHPKNYDGMSWGNDWDFPDRSRKNFSRYFENKALPQIEELLTNYGEVVELWCDCPLDIEKKYSEKLRDTVRKFQPDCRINSRIGNGCGDFDSLGDNQIMTCRQTRPCESPITLNHTWGFKYDDEDWKSAALIAERMAALASRDANLLVNVGPRPDGKFPDGTLRILNELAAWHKNLPPNVLAGSSPGCFTQNFDWGYATTTGNIVNFFLKKKNGPITVTGIRNRVIAADGIFSQKDKMLTLDLQNIPDSLLPLIRVTLDGKPDVAPGFFPQNGVLTLTPASGKIFAAPSKIIHEKIGVDGVRHTDNDHMRCAPDGTLTAWHIPEDRIEWEISFPYEGNFRIEIITFMSFHARPWYGDREVEILFNEQSIAKSLLVADREIESGTHPAAVSIIGEISFSPETNGKISLHTTRLLSDNAKMMNLVEIRFAEIK